ADAAATARAADMCFHTAAAELSRARLAGGDATEVARWLAAEDVRQPEALCAMIAPGPFTRG
ncbi:MAG TPA: hypothetical protein VK932_29600, partial [Kofleriaceae bacterium]|nr:hypothetical protein [Kofleriaceae bacterium]